MDDDGDKQNKLLVLRCEASNIANVPQGKPSDGKEVGFFLHIRRKIGIGEGALFEFELVARTEVCWCAYNQAPVWEPLQLSTERLCRNRRSTPLKIELYRWSRNGIHQLLSCAFSTLSTMSVPVLGGKGAPPRRAHLAGVANSHSKAGEWTE